MGRGGGGACGENGGRLQDRMDRGHCAAPTMAVAGDLKRPLMPLLVLSVVCDAQARLRHPRPHATRERGVDG